VAAFLSYLSYRKGNDKSLFIMLVLIATLLIEISSRIFYLNRISGYTFILHLFNLFEYSMFCMYYLKTCKTNQLKTVVRISIPIFIVFGLCSSWFLYHFIGLPVLNIDVEGFLLFIIYSHLLFNLDDDENMVIYAHPDFWISIGILIFFGGAFIFLGLYPILLHMDAFSALTEYGAIITPLNMIFYNCIIIGLICLIRNKRYSIQ